MASMDRCGYTENSRPFRSLARSHARTHTRAHASARGQAGRGLLHLADDGADDDDGHDLHYHHVDSLHTAQNKGCPRGEEQKKTQNDLTYYNSNSTTKTRYKLPKFNDDHEAAENRCSKTML